jgi:hypothetical protein
LIYISNIPSSFFCEYLFELLLIHPIKRGKPSNLLHNIIKPNLTLILLECLTIGEVLNERPLEPEHTIQLLRIQLQLGVVANLLLFFYAVHESLEDALVALDEETVEVLDLAVVVEQLRQARLLALARQVVVVPH